MTDDTTISGLTADEAVVLLRAGPLVYEAEADGFYCCPQVPQPDGMAYVERPGGVPDSVTFDEFRDAWKSADDPVVHDRYHVSDAMMDGLYVDQDDWETFCRIAEAYASWCDDQWEEPTFGDGHEQDRFFWATRARRIRDVLDRSEWSDVAVTYVEAHAVRAVARAAEDFADDVAGVRAIGDLMDARIRVSGRLNAG